VGLDARPVPPVDRMDMRKAVISIPALLLSCLSSLRRMITSSPSAQLNGRGSQVECSSHNPFDPFARVPSVGEAHEATYDRAVEDVGGEA